jgi:hypothetical protein
MRTVNKSNINLKNLNILKVIDLAYWSDNTAKFSLYGTPIYCKRSTEKNFSISDNTEEVSFSLKNVNTVEASTQMFNTGEPRTNSGEPINNYNYGGRS